MTTTRKAKKRKLPALTKAQMQRVIRYHVGCSLAQIWVAQQRDRTAEAIWNKCEQGSWLAWVANRVAKVGDPWAEGLADPDVKAALRVEEIVGRLENAERVGSPNNTLYNQLARLRQDREVIALRRAYPWSKMEPHFRRTLKLCRGR